MFGRALFDHRTRRLVFTGLTAFALSGCISYQRATHITNEDATRTLYNFEVENERVMRVWQGDAD